MNNISIPNLESHSRTALATNSGPLSDLMCFGMPCLGIRRTSRELCLRATSIARHWRVNSSTTVRNFRGLPSRGPLEHEVVLSHSTQVRLQVYDLLGRRVRRLVAQDLAAGTYRIVWDGTDDRRQAVAAGVYFYRLVAGEFAASQKLTMLDGSKSRHSTGSWSPKAMQGAVRLLRFATALRVTPLPRTIPKSEIAS